LYNWVMLNDFISTLIPKLIVLFISFPIHEFSHAYVADYFGDDTPRRAGRLTLYPPAHWDVLGSLLLIISFIGWAKPVPINPYLLNRRSRWAEMWVSLAGPLSNLGLAVLAAIPIRLGLVRQELFSTSFLPSLFQILYIFIYINLILAIFNLIPFSPLDGEKVLTPFLPPAFAEFMNRVRPYGPLFLLAIVFILPRLGIDIISLLIQPLMVLLLRFPF
jgi:Zn-dependent protease